MKAKHTVVLLCTTLLAAALGASEQREGAPYHETQMPGRYRQWRQSDDKQISVHLTADRTTFTAAEGITVRCVVRNHSDKPVTILRPFGDDYFAHSTGLNILGPDGPVEYEGAHKDYTLGTSSFVELPATSVIEASMTIPKLYFPNIDKPGLYVIEYRYLSNGHPSRPPPDNYWKGYVDSNPVTVLVK
jgi:hypothetical protein